LTEVDIAGQPPRQKVQRWRWLPFWVGLCTGIATALVGAAAIFAVVSAAIDASYEADSRSADYGFEDDISWQVAKPYLQRNFPEASASGDISSSTGGAGVFGTVDVQWGEGDDAQAMEIVVNTVTREIVATSSVEPGF